MKEVPSLPERIVKEGEIYKHFKGGLYKVLCVALHTTTDEWMVVYEPMYECPGLTFSVRPLSEWFEIVVRDGKESQRFTLVE